MKRTRHNPDNWLVGYAYSYLFGRHRWRVWRPGNVRAELISFDSPAEAHNWIRKKIMVEERDIARNAQSLEEEEFDRRLMEVLTR